MNTSFFLGGMRNRLLVERGFRVQSEFMRRDLGVFIGKGQRTRENKIENVAKKEAVVKQSPGAAGGDSIKKQKLR